MFHLARFVHSRCLTFRVFRCAAMSISCILVMSSNCPEKPIALLLWLLRACCLHVQYPGATGRCWTLLHATVLKINLLCSTMALPG